MSYTSNGIDARAEVLEGEEDTLVTYLKANGAAIPPDANTAWVTIFDPSGTQLVARTQTGVAQAASGQLSFTRTWDATTFERWEDYVALWEWQVSGATFKDRQFFDVVKTKLPVLIDTNDIIEIYPDIEEHIKSIGETDCTKFIKRAWSHMLDRIRAGKNRPSLILDRSRLVNPAIHLTCFYICNALKRAVGDVWDTRRAEHKEEWQSLFGGLGELKYDIDEDGLVAEAETKRVNRKTWGV